MKVALIHHSLARKGGLERYLFDLIEGFRQRDELELFARDIDAGAIPDGIPVQRLVSPRWPRSLKTLLLARAVARLNLAQRYDFSLSLARTRGQDVYVCGGSHLGFVHATGRRRPLFDAGEHAAERAAVAASRFVVAHSQRVANELREYCAAADEQIQVLYPPLDTRRFRPGTVEERRAARSALALPEGATVFLFVASGDLVNKELASLLKAFAALASVPAVLVVAGSAASAVQSTQTIRTVGPYTQDMRSLYLAADCTVLPSRYEAFGLVLSESLQCGTGVLTTKRTGAAELVGPADGIVLPENAAVSELAEAMRTICQAPIAPPPDFAQRHGLEGFPAHIAALRKLARPSP